MQVRSSLRARGLFGALAFALAPCVGGACGDSAAPADDTALDAGSALDRDASDPAQTPLDAGDPPSEAGADGGAETALIDHTAWSSFDAAADPLASHQPAQISCGFGGYFADPVYHDLDVETAYCNYLLVAHPAQVEVRAGDTLRLRFYYFDLLAPEPAEAHVAVLLDDTVGWESTVPIPSRANAIDTTFVAPRALAVGDPIRFHLHNHGQNSWVLTSLTLLQ